MSPFRNNNVDDQNKKKGPTIVHLENDYYHDDVEHQKEDFDDDDDNRTDVTTTMNSSSQHERITQTDAEREEGNKILRIAVVVLGLLSPLLIGFIVGATVTASSKLSITTTLAGSTDIDPHTGITYAHDGLEHPVIKTEDAIFYSDNLDIVNMSNDELKVLKEILLDDGNVKFLVKGYGRGFNNNNDGSSSSDDPIVHLIVEGGTLTFDAFGILDASGHAVNMILDAAFPQPHVDADGTDGGGRHRRLPSGCTGGRSGSGSESSF